MERIVSLVDEKKLDGIANLRNESDGDGIRMYSMNVRAFIVPHSLS